MKQVFSGSNHTLINSTYYYSVVGGSAGSVSADSNSYHPWSVAGKFKNLRISLTAGPGAGTTRTFTLYVNGVASALTVTFSDSETLKTDDVNEVTVAAGDYVYLRHSVTGSTTSAVMQYNFVFEATDTAKSAWARPSVSVMADAVNPNYLGLFSMGGGAPNATGPENMREVAPCDMVIDRWDIRLGNTSPGSGNSWAFVIYKNGVAQDGTGGTPNTTLTISGTSRAGSATFSLSISENDLIYVVATPTSSPQTVLYPHISVSITPTGGIPAFSSCVNNPTASANNWATGFNWGGNWFATEKFNNGGYPDAFRLAKLKVHLSVAPGAGKNYTFYLRKNGSNVLSCVISGDSATEGSDNSNYMDLTISDTFSVLLTPSGTPAVARVTWSALMQEPAEANEFSSLGFGPLLGNSRTGLSFG